MLEKTAHPFHDYVITAKVGTETWTIGYICPACRYNTKWNILIGEKMLCHQCGAKLERSRDGKTLLCEKETPDPQPEPEEIPYTMGYQMAWSHMLQECLKRVASPDDKTAASLAKERFETLVKLRELCRDFGDNDWTDNLHLADVVEKHLGKHLYNPRSEKDK